MFSSVIIVIRGIDTHAYYIGEDMYVWPSNQHSLHTSNYGHSEERHMQSFPSWKSNGLVFTLLDLQICIICTFPNSFYKPWMAIP